MNRNRNSSSAKQIFHFFVAVSMLTEDLFKKLRPILGAKLDPLQALYLAGDDDNRKTVEQMLRVMYSTVITGISPPPFEVCSGKYPLGVILSGDKALYPFALRDEDWFHLGIFGLTGRGKTNAMLHLLGELQKHNIPWLVFDWKRAGYRDLVSRYDKVSVFTVGRDVSPFCFNPLIPPPGVDRIASNRPCSTKALVNSFSRGAVTPLGNTA